MIRGKLWCDFDIVGESHYQDALRKIVRRRGAPPLHCTADLVFEPANPHDANAVMVRIEGLKVGYLTREDAVQYGEALVALDCKGATLSCPAYIAGTEWLGVKLGLVWPIEEATSPGAAAWGGS